MGMELHTTTAWGLLRAARPLPTLAFSAGLAAAAAISGRPPKESLLVAATVATGQVAVHWVTALRDRHRTGVAARWDSPVGEAGVDPGTVAFATALVVLLLVPLSMANGTAAGLAHLAAVALWLAGALWFRRSALSPLPTVLAWGLLPAFLAYGGLGGGVHGAPPTWTMTVLAAMLGLGVHVLGTLRHLVPDHKAGMTHLPLRLALRIGAGRLLWASLAWTGLVGVGIVIAALTAGLRQ